VLLDVLGKSIIDFIMTRNWLLLTGCGVDVNIMPTTVPVKSATLLLKLPDKPCALHRATSFV
jgi:hypothetical protein